MIRGRALGRQPRTRRNIPYPMRSLLFWSALPFVLPQAMWVRARAPRFAGPAAAAEGLA